MLALFTKWRRTRRSRVSVTRRACLQVEALEARAVPTASGNAWVHPELVTISFVPDGTNLGGQSSNLFSTFNAKFGSASAWQSQIVKAAQVWAQQTNLNFAVVSDSGADSGSGNYQQGDSTFGDIRIGGFNYGPGNNTLAAADFPPPVNNYSIAGDITFNTGQAFNINGQNYDLMTVAIHEIGHAIGLNHSTAYYADMYPTYVSVRRTLNSDDISVVQSIYSGGSARSADAYDAASSNGSFSTATNISSQINPTALTAVVNNMDITTTSDLDYYTFTAPSGSSSNMTVTVQSSGLSLLSPKVTVYASNQVTVLGSANGSGQYGATLLVPVSGISAGQQFYVKVQGADTTANGTGKYALTLNLGTGSAPTVTLPNTQTANGNPLQGGGGIADTGKYHGHNRGPEGDNLEAASIVQAVDPCLFVHTAASPGSYAVLSSASSTPLTLTISSGPVSRTESLVSTLTDVTPRATQASHSSHLDEVWSNLDLGVSPAYLTDLTADL